MRAILRNIYLNFSGFFKNPEPGIHIINAHYVNKLKFDRESNIKAFDKFISYLSSLGRVVELKEAVALINSGDLPTSEIIIALTFDDGFEECYHVLAPILEKYGTRGTFFINANYIDSNDEYQKGFNDRINLHSKKPMTWKQVEDLHKRGHIIGSHTLDHLKMSNLNVTDTQYQILENKNILESNLKYTCDFFAWPYGQFEDFNEMNLEETLKSHKYIFSGTDYKNYFSYGKSVINRRHLEPNWNKYQIKYFLSTIKK